MGVDARMLVRTHAKVTEADVRRWSYELVSAFGTDRLMVTRPGKFSWWPEGRHALEVVEVYQQDGPDVVPNKGETLIEVHLFTRYYGEGYERGDLPTIVAVAEYLERKIPGASIWYGGDSSGVCVESFHREARARLFAHFAEHGHAPYRTYFDRDTQGTAPLCGFCDMRMVQHGWGGRGQDPWALYGCSGCGLELESRDNGKTFAEPKKEEKP